MNRQVPKCYCLIGDGKVARHMAHYFDLLGINYTRWSRANEGASSPRLKQPNSSQRESLKQALFRCDHVLILISDDQIENFINSSPELIGHNLVHFSGALTTPLAATCHPLMTFSHSIYDLESYQKIPFIHQAEFDFKSTFPQLNNPSHTLNAKDQALYHAYCVMAGNFSQMMWLNLGEKMQNLGLPKNIMHPYLLQNTANFIDAPELASTGPLVRGDGLTIEKHMAALKDDDLQDIYSAYLTWQKPQISHNKKAVL